MSTAALVIFLLYLASAIASPQCFFPDGVTIATNMVACNSSASNTVDNASSCCNNYRNSYCLANGLCQFEGIISRGACTDKTWGSPACAQQCASQQRNSEMNIFPCHSSGVWQCEWGDCATNFTLAGKNLNAGYLDIVLRDDQAPGGGSAVKFGNPALAFVSNSSLAKSKEANTNSTASTAPVDVTTQKGPSATVVGLAVGIPLAALVAVCAVLLFLQRKRVKAAQLSANNAQQSRPGWQYQKMDEMDGAYARGVMPDGQVVSEMGAEERNNAPGSYEMGNDTAVGYQPYGPQNPL